eukprot:SAG22_NODE_3550_length_1649_cov_3.387742_1_plen_97_part_10
MLLSVDGTLLTRKYHPQNQDGVEAERQEVRSTLVEAWEGGGWRLRRPIERLWGGERELATLCRGCDPNSADVVGRILGAAADDEVAAAATAAHQEAH